MAAPDTDKKQEAATDAEGFVRANVNRKVVESPTFTSYYANDTQIQTSPWDIRLTFGQITDVDQENKCIVVTKLADVRLSLQHAKVVANLLQQQIQQYEARVGVIPLPATDITTEQN